ncbi:hypothetical protein B0H15DRAFT_777894 [Mycena belliarum]|uniref:Integrase core domain-containing protein n=1 Tax=Mycena belliarum TaxID=1033014 RepID=A0AAD6XTQ7_9AGAR|nr:hypothetical protein B0H15DRAFT_777894 [Mycena belliae]
MSISGPAQQELLDAFREHYHRYVSSVQDAVTNSADTVVLWRLGDDLEQYINLIEEVFYLAAFQITIADSRSIYIDPDFLRWAYSLRSTASIARFLGVSRSIVRRALLEHGIAAPQEQPTVLATGYDESDYLTPDQPPNDENAPAPAIASYTGPLSCITDDELDGLLLRLRQHYRRAGITMFDGMLRRLGHHVPRARIRESLLRIDPVQRVFQRITIRRRVYSVPGPNSLWHHDGQHGESVHNVRIERLWGDVTAQVGASWADMFTMLEMHHGLNINNVHHIWLLHYLFLHQINEQLRFFMEAWNQHRIQIRRGTGPNRSPADMFGFDMLVHGVRGSVVPGVQELLPEDAAPMSEEDMEVFGVDWEALRDDNILEWREENNPIDEGSTSWLGRRGPPANLNEITVEPPEGPFSAAEMQALEAALLPLAGAVDDAGVANLWTEGLSVARHMRGDLF